jgi:hypothetical protein
MNHTFRVCTFSMKLRVIERSARGSRRRTDGRGVAGRTGERRQPDHTSQREWTRRSSRSADAPARDPAITTTAHG